VRSILSSSDGAHSSDGASSASAAHSEALRLISEVSSISSSVHDAYDELKQTLPVLAGGSAENELAQNQSGLSCTFPRAASLPGLEGSLNRLNVAVETSLAQKSESIVQAQVIWKVLSTTISALSNMSIERARQLAKGGGAGSRGSSSSAQEGSDSPAAPKQALQARNEELSSELAALGQSHKELQATLHKAEQSVALLETEKAHLAKSLDHKFESGGQEAGQGKGCHGRFGLMWRCVGARSCARFTFVRCLAAMDAAVADLKRALEKAEQDKARLEKQLAEVLRGSRSGVSSEVRGLLWGRERLMRNRSGWIEVVVCALPVPVHFNLDRTGVTARGEPHCQIVREAAASQGRLHRDAPQRQPTAYRAGNLKYPIFYHVLVGYRGRSTHHVLWPLRIT